MSCCLFAGVVFAAPPPPPPPGHPAMPGMMPGAPAKPPPPLTADDEKKALYTLGVLITKRSPLGQVGLDEADLKVVLQGLKDGAMGKEPSVKMEEAGPLVDRYLRQKQLERGEAEKKKGEEYLAKKAAEPGAQKLPSGIVYIETQAGTGPSPTAADKVSVHYKGTLVDGKEFDSSYKRNQPAEFPLTGVIKCWTEGVQKMKVGGKATLVCPADLAYGPGGRGGIPPNAVLTFEIELLSIVGK